MSTYWLLALLLTSLGCLVVQAFDLDTRLDARLAAFTQPGDDGCWLDSALIVAWCAAFILFFVINVGGYL